MITLGQGRGAANRPWSLETLIYEGVKLDRGEDLFQPVRNTHTPLFIAFTQLFYVPSLQHSTQNNYS